VKDGQLQVVKEISDHHNLPSAIEKYDAEWVIVSLPNNQKVPAWVDEYMAEHPPVRFIAVSSDGSQVKIMWMESHEKNYDDLTLEDLIHILESKPSHAGARNSTEKEEARY